MEKGGLGAKVAIFDLNEEAGNATAAELGADVAIFWQTDVISEESVQASVSAVVEKFGTIQININAAGVPAPCKVLGREDNAT